jgi:hypothetical protein
VPAWMTVGRVPGPPIVDFGGKAFQQAGSSVAVEDGGRADIHVQGAQIRGDRIALAALDGGDGELARQRELRAGLCAKVSGGEHADQVRGFLDRAGSGRAAARMRGHSVYVQPGAVHAASADDELVHAGVADHDSCHIARCAGAFEVAPGPAEASGVLVNVEQQDEAAMYLAGHGGQADGDMAEDRCTGLGVGAPASPEPAVLDQCRSRCECPGALVAERRGIQARVKHPPRSGPGSADLAGHANRDAGLVREHHGGKAMARQPGDDPADHRFV